MTRSIRCLYLFLVILLAGLLFLPGYTFSEQSSDSAATPVDNLTYYTEELPPYSYVENGTLRGFTVDILEEIAGMTGTGFSREMVHVLPWDEGYEAALSGNRTVIFSTARTPDREDSFRWVGPISMERYVLFAHPDPAITINGTEDLKGFRIGVIADDASTRLLLDAGVEEGQIVTGNTATELIAKLRDKEIDLWCYPEITGRYYTGKVTGYYDAFPVVYSLDEVGIYYAFSLDVPEPEIRSWQNSLDRLKEGADETGVNRYDQIVGQYIPS